jgi:hypothetical protein
MTKKVVKNERLVCILVQANDVKEALITQWESCSTMGEYSIPAVSESPLYVFPIFLRRRRFGKIEKFNAQSS